MSKAKMTGRRVRRIRKRLGLSMNKFARILNTAHLSIVRWELDRSPVYPAIVPILEALEILPDKKDEDFEVWDRVMAGERIGGDGYWLSRLFKIAFDTPETVDEEGNRRYTTHPITLRKKGARGRKSVPPELRMVEHRLLQHLRFSDQDFGEVLWTYKDAFREVMERLEVAYEDMREWLGTDVPASLYKQLGKRTWKDRKSNAKKNKR